MSNPIRVVLVDDESDFTDPIAFWLKGKGYEATTFTNGNEAIENIKNNPPDIVFLDINMPVIDGLEVLEKIRSFNKEIPIIMVTAAYSSEENISKAKAFGIAGFFSKNYTFDQLVQMIQVALRTHKNLQ